MSLDSVLVAFLQAAVHGWSLLTALQATVRSSLFFG